MRLWRNLYCGGMLLALAGALATAGAQETPSRGLWQRSHPLTVERGVLTVNGLVVTTGLNFRVSDFRYLYLDVPGVGMAVVSDRPFAGGEEQPAAFRGGVLNIVAGTSRIQLSAVHKMHGNGAAYVRFEPGVRTGAHMPRVGYGGTVMSRATWMDDAGGLGSVRRRKVTLRNARALREVKLCRPSRKGPEKCALVREVRWHE